MAYIGRNPAIGTQKVLDSLESQFNGTLTTFDLRYGTNTIYPPIASALIVSLGGVLQEPGEAYTVASDTITFASAPPAGADCWILLYTEFGGAAGATANLTVSNNLTIGNELYGPANFVIDPAAIGDDTGNVEIKGNLTVQGTTTTVNSTTTTVNQISLGDNDKALFGDGNDLQIYHDGSQSYIGADDLRFVNKSISETYAIFINNGSVALYYDNNKKFETTSDGVKITGRNFSTGDYAYFSTSSSSNASLTIKKSAAGADAIDYLQLRDSNNTLKLKLGGDGVIYSSDVLASHEGDTDTRLRFPGNDIFAIEAGGGERFRANSSGAIVTGAFDVDGSVGIGNAAASSGIGRFNVKPHNSQDSYFKIRPASDFDGLVVGSAIDIRNGANNDSHHLIVRAEEYRLWCGDLSGEKIRITNTGNVGIGTNDPVAKFNVNGQSVFNSTESSNESNVPLYLAVEAIASVATGAGAVCPGVLRIKDKGANNNRFCGIDIRNRNSGDIRILNYDTNTANQADMVFAVDADSVDGIVEAMRIKGSTQNVGIGTITPSGKLEVAGTIVQSSIEYPTIRPVLDLNFAATKTLDRRITFTRDGVGTYYDELGVLRYASNNVPRFDHDSTTGESLGLLIEESRTNKFGQSTTIGGTGWAQQGSAADYTTNTTEVAAPDGTFTALKWNPSSIPQYLYQNLTNIGTTQSTMSVWVRCPDGQSRTFFMNLYSPSQNTGAGSFTATDQWQRFTWTFTPQSQANVYPIVPDSTGIYYVWAPQLEEGAFATSYIPTSETSVTRGADIVTIKGTNFTSFHNATEGTLYGEYKSASGTAPYLVMLSDGTNNNRTIINTNYDSYQGVVKYNNGTNQAVIDGGTPIANANNKTALAFKKDDFALSLNGGTVATDTSGDVSVNTMLTIGSRFGSDSFINSTINAIKYYNKRLPNAQLQGLTYL